MEEAKKSYILSILLGVIASILCIATFVLLYKSTVLGTVYLKTSGNPEETVTWFYECIESGDYDMAYTCLADFSDLGFNSNDMENEIINEALKKSYKCEILNDVRTEGLMSFANVKFTYLDLLALQEKLENSINPVLKSYVEELSRDELYDDNGDYKQEFLKMVYDEVLEEIIKKDNDIYRTATYQVEMKYTDDGWKIMTNKDMIRCFLGGKSA